MITRIGGEMYSWSDHDPARGPKVAAGGALRHVLTELAAPGQRVLVAGPHDDALIAALIDRGAQVSCLARSVLDADRLDRTFPAAEVLCGSVVKLDETVRYDLVVAADGLDRLGSTEGGQAAPAEVLRILATVVEPDGALALMTDNPLGVHRLVELNPAGHYDSDAAWYPVRGWAASLDQVRGKLNLHGLPEAAVYAVYPTPDTATVLVGSGLFGDVAAPLRGPLGAVLSRAFTAAYREVPVLSDPRRLTARALAAGAEGTMAPGWLTIARRGCTLARHEVVASDGYTYELSSTGLRVLESAAPVERHGLRRVTAPQADLAGLILEERLLPLFAHVDVAGLRAELQRLVAWLDGRAEGGVIAGPAALATAETLLDDGYDLRPVPPTWEPIDPVPVDVVVARALWNIAVRLITGGHPHPWALTSSALDLVSILAATVGRPLRAEDLRAAIDLQVALDAADGDLSLTDERARRADLLAVQPGRPTIDVAGYRELEEALWRQRYQVSHLLAEREWTEHIIGSRDNALSRMDWEVQLFRRSFFGKLLMLAKAFYRSLRRDGGRALRLAANAAKGDTPGSTG
ncbi:hypothetical protein GCM10009682_35230 [Luedemannella flava]|uniref:Class I SAM-dependent methyltransferase n=1 Tax=Luedemannella flava TaxID=349316 RepID=A0ABN2M796_9ACTN